jgi:glycosyltransferase involved in cell wall biosynthesis
VIAVSEATKHDVVELLGFPADRVSVVHLGVPLHFRPQPESQPDARPLVVFVGEIAARKNVRVLVEAFARAAVPDAQLVLAGSPGLGSEDVDAAIERLGLSGSVRRLGHAPQQVVDTLVADADVLVLPSLDEGFGIPALEAMSAGTAVVVSDAGSLPEVVGDAGLVVPVGDVDALAGAIGRVLTDDDLRLALGARGRTRAATFSWTDAATKTIEVYEHALG